MFKKIGLLLFIIFFVVGGYLGLQYYAFYNEPVGNAGGITFEIKSGAAFGVVARQLKEQGLIKDERAFKLLAMSMGLDKELRAGEYSIGQKFTGFEVLKVITSGTSIKYPLVIPEGTNIFELADLVDRRGVGSGKIILSLANDAKFIKKELGQNYVSLEGYLFPDTYHFTKYDGEKRILQTMLQRFKHETKGILNSTNNLKPHEIIILASIIEKETAAPEERRLISSVFHNRIKKGMKLQTDPTIIYAYFVETGKRLFNIKRSHILSKNAYNTYVIKGLPKGPIGNPGKKSIEAALNPAESSYLFFVSRNNGTHVFTSKYKDHLKAVRLFQLNK